MHTHRKPNFIRAGTMAGMLMSLIAMPATMVVAIVAAMAVVVPRIALAAEEEAGLPQLDFATWPTQVFWLVVSFGLAYVLMWRVVVPTIGSVLEERHTRIEENLKRARLAADEASEVREWVEKQLADARATATKRTRAASDATAKRLEVQIQATDQALGKKIAESEAAITDNKNRVLAEATTMAAVAAAVATEKLTAIKTSEKEAAECIASFVGEGRGNKHG